jgi:hypothetical protein
MLMREEIPFIRVLRLIPREMRDKLPQEYISLLETTVSFYLHDADSISTDPGIETDKG